MLRRELKAVSSSDSRFGAQSRLAVAGSFVGGLLQGLVAAGYLGQDEAQLLQKDWAHQAFKAIFGIEDGPSTPGQQQSVHSRSWSPDPWSVPIGCAAGVRPEPIVIASLESWPHGSRLRWLTTRQMVKDSVLEVALTNNEQSYRHLRSDRVFVDDVMVGAELFDPTVRRDAATVTVTMWETQLTSLVRKRLAKIALDIR